MLVRLFLLILCQFCVSNAFAWTATATGKHPNNPNATTSAVNRFTEKEARDVALQLCQARYTDCRIFSTFYNTCSAIAEPSDSHGLYEVLDANLQNAKAAALSKCQTQARTRSCRITSEWCDRTPVATTSNPNPAYVPPYQSDWWTPWVGGGAFLVIVVLGFKIYSSLKWRKPHRDLSGINTVRSHEQPLSPEKDHARKKVRDRQLAALRAAVPPNPPERMRATIQLNEYKVPRIEERRVPRFGSEDDFTYVEVGEDFKFSVDMILEMSETERALIRQHELDDIVLEDVPKYTADELAALARQDDQRVRATKDMILEQVQKNVNELSTEHRKSERRITRVGDLLVAPFTREFDSPHQAKQHAETLKTKFLPEVRKLLDGHTGHKQSETLEF